MMIKKMMCPLVIMGVLLFTASASADLYKYKDPSGVTRFTNDLSKVPADQRQNIELYEEVVAEETMPDTEDQAQTADTPDTEGEDQPADTDEEAVSGSQPDESEDLTKLKYMNRKKAELDNEYETLVREKEELAKMKEEIETKPELEEYRERFNNLNLRISDYDVRRQAFSKEVDAFNQGIEKKALSDKTEK